MEKLKVATDYTEFDPAWYIDHYFKTDTAYEYLKVDMKWFSDAFKKCKYDLICFKTVGIYTCTRGCLNPFRNKNSYCNNCYHNGRNPYCNKVYDKCFVTIRVATWFVEL